MVGRYAHIFSQIEMPTSRQQKQFLFTSVILKDNKLNVDLHKPVKNRTKSPFMCACFAREKRKKHKIEYEWIRLQCVLSIWQRTLRSQLLFIYCAMRTRFSAFVICVTYATHLLIGMCVVSMLMNAESRLVSFQYYHTRSLRLILVNVDFITQDLFCCRHFYYQISELSEHWAERTFEKLHTRNVSMQRWKRVDWVISSNTKLNHSSTTATKTI